ncbi:hypothetical protein MTO96_029262 [Rhipicephalus appendiculatus]
MSHRALYALDVKETKRANLIDCTTIPHVKQAGVLMASQGPDGGAVWLQHSVPRFVDNVTKEYEYPESGRENGQLFFCISFPLEAVETISLHLRVQGANVYQSRGPEWTFAYGEFWYLLHKVYKRDKKVLLRIDFLVTNEGRPVMLLAKPPRLLTGNLFSMQCSRTASLCVIV